MTRALAYMNLTPGQALEGVPIDYAFIGSCTNSRLSDLEAAAAVLEGRKVRAGVTALVVPGSMSVKAAAEARGLDKVFRDAGFEWRNSGCSMCVTSNGDIVAPGKRCDFDHQSQFRAPSGAAEPHPPREPRHGRGRGGRGLHHRRAQAPQLKRRANG